MLASRLAVLAFATVFPLAASAQLVVRDDALPSAPNPADQVPYPRGGSNCNNTLADAGARAVLRAIDRCPETFFDSREAYLSYARQAVLGLLVPGASEAAGALIVDKAAENALFCISGALIDESGADDADKAFLKALIAEAKELSDRAEFVEKLGEFRTALKERGAAGYLDDGNVQTFVKTLDVTLQERYEGLGTEGALVRAGRSRYDTSESRARDATEAARALARECRYADAEAALAQAQQANLAFLADLRAQVSKAKHFRYCIERDARQQPINALNPPSPFLDHSLASADAEIEAAQRRDAEQTRLIGQLADLQQSVHARRNDIDALKQRAARHLEAARQAGGNCDWNAAASALDTLNTETLECALQLDAERRAREQLAQQIEELKRQLGVLENEYASVIATPFAAVDSCGAYSIFADVVDRFQGQCRTLAGIDAKVATLRQRARECADFKTGAKLSGALVGKATLTPPFFEDAGARGHTRAEFTARRHTWERVDRTYPYEVQIAWDYHDVPDTLTPGQNVVITVTGGVVSESPKGAGDGTVLAGAVAVYGDVTVKSAQQADRGHPTGRYEFVVNPNAQSVEIHLGGWPMGTGAIWKYTRAP